VQDKLKLEVRAYCRRLISEVGPSGFILSSGCDVPIDAKYENVKAMVEAVL
jgi:uroporphyrinogen-III decarboxylase